VNAIFLFCFFFQFFICGQFFSVVVALLGLLENSSFKLGFAFVVLFCGSESCYVW